MNRYKNVSNQLSHKRAFLSSKISFFLLAVLAITVCALTVWNTIAMLSAINNRTKSYVSDVSIQLANDIDNRLNKVHVDLEMITESLLQNDGFENTDELIRFLKRDSEILGFTSIILVDENKNLYCTNPIEEDILQMPGMSHSLAGANGVSFLNQQSILYSIPIYQEEKVVGVLGGVRNKENMQALIQPKSFSGQGLTCIIDQDGKVIISPTDLNAFMQLNSIFLEGDSQTTQDIEQMQRNMKENQSGIFSFTAVDGSDLVLSYNPLNSYHWFLLTLVPSDIISHEINRYSTRNNFIVIGVVVSFFLTLTVFYISHNNHYKRLTQAAFVDRVTQGMNNTAFQLKCQQLLQNEAPNTYTIVILNIKNFKLINENFGSAQGDKTLRHVMNTLLKNIHPDEAAARADSDHFFLCLKEQEEEAVRARLQTIVEHINTFPQTHDYEPYHFIIQPGAYIVDNPTLEITVIQDRAKTANKSRNANQDGVCIFYNANFTQQLQKEHTLNDLFEISLQNRYFEVYLQPKVWLKNGKAGGAEALIRWNHPQRGLIAPGEFIDLFERNGKICRLDFYVFEEVCKTISSWIQAGHFPLPVSVNLSRQHFKNPDCLIQLKQIADQYHVPTSLLELELTESIFFDDKGIEQVKNQIGEMHRLGFRCSLDDFGAGYSSLGLLMEFDVDAIKLDRRFFLHVDRPKTKDVVKSIVDLAQKIDAQVVAEGIETEEQLRFLQEVGCELVQGYIYSKPLPIHSFEQDWLQ